MLVSGLAVGPVAQAAQPHTAASNPQQGMPERSLGSVSCVGASFCLGVGPYGSQIGAGPTFSQIWNGTTWRTVSVPSPRPFGFGLGGVSCTSAKNCIAVGGKGFNLGGQLSDAWNGGSWRALPAPTINGRSELVGVDCTAARHCIAVGTGNNGRVGQVLAQIWNGTSWSLTSPVRPKGSIQSSFQAISCPRSSNCVAVGGFITSRTQIVDTPLAESWNGHAWTLLPAPPGFSTVNGVACPTVKVCVAVGSGPQGEVDIASAVWNGTSWTTLTTPSPTKHGDVSQTLTGVSCTSATSCIASGSGPTPINDGVGAGPFAEKWAGGSSWTLLSVPNPRPIEFQPGGGPGIGANGLAGVSCVSAVRCMAVGGQGETEALSALASFAVSWNGQRWTVLRTGHIDGLFGVSCTAGSRCLTTGTFLDKNDVTKTLAESVTGSVVRLVSSASLGGVLSAVSCPSASFCLASMGASAVSWNGKKWTSTGPVTKTVFRTDPEGIISVLSCSSKNFCMATGQPDASFGEFWNGKSWHSAPLVVPKKKNVAIGISDLSCATARHCLAVGFWETGSGNGQGGTLAEAWNGSTWKILGSPGRFQSDEALDSVSCFASTGCMLIGSTEGTHLSLFAARWNGKQFKVTKLPGQYPDVLWSGNAEGPALSCATATSCVAAGSYAVPPIHQPLTINDLGLIWNGRTWRISNPDGPAGLSAVSCSSASRCVAIGQPGTATLAKGWNGHTWKVINTINP